MISCQAKAYISYLDARPECTRTIDLAWPRARFMPGMNGTRLHQATRRSYPTWIWPRSSLIPVKNYHLVIEILWLYRASAYHRISTVANAIRLPHTASRIWCTRAPPLRHTLLLLLRLHLVQCLLRLFKLFRLRLDSRLLCLELLSGLLAIE